MTNQIVFLQFWLGLRTLVLTERNKHIQKQMWLPGHVQPSIHSSLQTSWMFRLWQVVEQDLVHSLYCIPMGHLGTISNTQTPHHSSKPFNWLSIWSLTNKLTAQALFCPVVQHDPMCVACPGVLQQDRAVAVLFTTALTVACFLLTHQQKGLWRD